MRELLMYMTRSWIAALLRHYCSLSWHAALPLWLYSTHASHTGTMRSGSRMCFSVTLTTASHMNSAKSTVCVWGGRSSENIVELSLYACQNHLVSLRDADNLDGVRLESATVDHVVHTVGVTDNDVAALLESLDLLADATLSEHRKGCDPHVCTQEDEVLVDVLGTLSRRGENDGLDLLVGDVDGLQDRDKATGCSEAR